MSICILSQPLRKRQLAIIFADEGVALMLHYLGSVCKSKKYICYKRLPQASSTNQNMRLPSFEFAQTRSILNCVFVDNTCQTKTNHRNLLPEDSILVFSCSSFHIVVSKSLDQHVFSCAKCERLFRVPPHDLIRSLDKFN
jgi:hypothetical protein